MDKKEIRLVKILGVVAVISAGILYFVMQPPSIETIQGTRSSRSNQESTSSPRASAPRRGGGGGGGSSSGGATSADEAVGGISIATFESHSTSSDCWVVIDGIVYNITAYLNTLSSDTEVASFCGTFGFDAGYINNSESLKEEVINQSVRMGTIRS